MARAGAIVLCALRQHDERNTASRTCRLLRWSEFSDDHRFFSTLPAVPSFFSSARAEQKSFFKTKPLDLRVQPEHILISSTSRELLPRSLD
jgi:hypothetical protein